MKFSKLFYLIKKIALAIWNYFFFIDVIDSPINGKIFIIRWFNHYDVSAGGCYQSGKYVTNMWLKMLKNVPKKHSIKQILVLGLGSGDTIRKIHKKYKTAQIIAVEYDPKMIQIAKRFVFKKYCPQIIESDATIAVKDFISKNKKFDIIIGDIFTGVNPSPSLYSKDFVANLALILEHNGYLLINFYRNKNLIKPIYDEIFSFYKLVRYKYNLLGIYRHFGVGNIGDPVPEGLKFKYQSLIYQKFSLKHFGKSKQLSKDNIWGQRFNWRLFYIDIYHSQSMPTIQKIKGLQIIIWHPISKTAKINGWHRNLFIKSGSQNGFVKLTPNYWQDWDHHAKRHRNDWLKSLDHYEIQKVTIDEFETEYHKSKKLNGFLRKAFLKSVKIHMAKSPCIVNCTLVKDKSTNSYIAGLITTDYPDISQSIHTIAFMRKEAKNTPAGYGVIIDWYENCLKTNINWINWGLLWKPGDPKDWRGYTKFKLQFKPYLIIFPRPYIKILFNTTTDD